MESVPDHSMTRLLAIKGIYVNTSKNTEKYENRYVEC
jgi:hypothetical protein